MGVRNLRLEVQAPRLSEALKATANGQFTSAQGGGSLDAQVQVRQPLESGRQITANVGAKSVPVALLEAVTGDQRFGALMGDTIDNLELRAETQADSQVAFTAGLAAPRMSGNLAGTYKAGEFLRLQDSPKALELELTPEAFAGAAPPPEDPSERAAHGRGERGGSGSGSAA